MGEVWHAECPLFDQGLVRPLLIEARIVLMCDECGVVWRTFDDLDGGVYEVASPPDFVLADGLSLRAEGARWATSSDLGDEPWCSARWHESDI